MDLTKVTEKEIMYNIMISLMKIEGYFAEMVNAVTVPEMLSGGDVDELTRFNKQS